MYLMYSSVFQYWRYSRYLTKAGSSKYRFCARSAGGERDAKRMS